MKSRNFQILFNGIILEKIVLNKEYTINELLKFSDDNESFGNVNHIIINAIHIQKNLYFQINFKEEYLVKKIEKFLKIKLNPQSNKIILYLEVLKYLGYINDSFLDNSIITDNGTFLSINYIDIMSERNHLLSVCFLKNYFNDDNYLLCYFVLRDLIENIKLYLYFLVENNNKIKEKLENENQDWDFNIKNIINKNPSLKNWKTELNEINKINNLCNSYIHKNGYSKIAPRNIRNNQEESLLNMWYKVIKFNFTIVACYDGKSISNSDYCDCLDIGIQPIKDSQYWVAPIFQKFIDMEYNSEEKEKLKKQSYMSIN